MKFKVYSDDVVKDKLNRLFNFKCAYCEGEVGSVMPVDVEHFRPKGGVIESTGNLRFPGYWWRASTWENLLPSCIDCNRSRWQKVGTEKFKRGKANLFPLLGGASPALDEAGVAGEYPLLINPAEDQPSEHLRHIYETLPNGKKLSLVQPAVNAAGTEDPKGRASIDTYGLNRSGLETSRRKMIQRMDSAFTSAETFFTIAQDEVDNVKAESYRDLGRREIRQLTKNFLYWKNPYSAACRAHYRTRLDDLRNRAP
jgi:uncharacterized protein (TIGR02646 family)